MKFRYREEHELKDSGVEWIGKMPKNWTLTKLKYEINTTKGFAFKADQFEEDGIKVVKASDIKNGTVIDGNTFIARDLYYNYEKVMLRYRDIVMSTVGSTPDVTSSAVGQLAMVPKNIDGALLNQNTVILKSRGNIDNEYLFMQLKGNKFRKYLDLYAHGTANQASLSLKDVLEFPLAIPILKEQIKIAKFLDEKTLQFDSIVPKKEALIQRLEEAKKSLISDVVTGKVKVVKTDDGFELEERNEDDMKDSGIEWIGKIPKDWYLRRLKYNCYMKGRIGWQGLKQSEFIDEGPYLITGMNFKNGKINWKEVYHISEERYMEAPEIQLKEGDVLITKDGTIGKLLYIDYLPDRASLNSHLLVMRPKNNDFISKYLYFSLDANYFKQYVEQVKTGTTFFGITQEAISKFPLILPSISEQIIITDYISNKVDNLDALINKTKKQIEKLKEAKQSLISEAVTGKIEILD